MWLKKRKSSNYCYYSISFYFQPLRCAKSMICATIKGLDFNLLRLIIFLNSCVIDTFANSFIIKCFGSKWNIHYISLFYSTVYVVTLANHQSAITNRFFDGVEEFENVGGGCDIDAHKHIIFYFQLQLTNKLFLSL